MAGQQRAHKKRPRPSLDTSDAATPCASSESINDLVSKLVQQVATKDIIHQKKNKPKKDPDTTGGTGTDNGGVTTVSNNPSVNPRHSTQKYIDRAQHQQALQRLAARMSVAVTEARRQRRLVATTSRGASSSSLGTSNDGHTVKFKKIRHDCQQPRPCDYGGLGLARPSLFLNYNDPAFFPKLAQEFVEHVPGFFGRARRPQTLPKNDNMLWRQLQYQKRHSGTVAINGRLAAVVKGMTKLR